MRLYTTFAFITFFLVSGFAQPNCAILKDSICIKACELSIEAAKYQGAKYSQELFDDAIGLCPNFAYAYYQKSIPYLKHAMIADWKKLIDKAVELEPKTYLVNRACNQIQFFRNYENGIKDLELLELIMDNFNIGYTNSGEYHAQMIRAIAYRKLGNIDKSISIMEKLTGSKWYSESLYDYFHLGISYFKSGAYEKAISAFEKQNNINRKAETYFYLHQVLLKLDRSIEAKTMLLTAKDLYENGETMVNNYYHYMDKIYLSDILDALENFQ